MAVKHGINLLLQLINERYTMLVLRVSKKDKFVSKMNNDLTISKHFIAALKAATKILSRSLWNLIPRIFLSSTSASSCKHAS